MFFAKNKNSHPPLDMRRFFGQIDDELKNSTSELIHWERMLVYYAQDQDVIRSIVDECREECRDVRSQLSRFTNSRDLNSLKVLLYRVLGMARYLFADRLVEACSVFIETLKSLSATESHCHPPAIKQLLSSLSDLLLRVLDDTFEAFSTIDESSPASRTFEQLQSADFFKERGMVDLSDDSTSSNESSFCSRRK